jgi:branched-chain amino acid transport system ATP-binding protein
MPHTPVPDRPSGQHAADRPPVPDRSQCALAADAVHKNFGGILAVNGADLAIPPGERRALIGPNGAGKTTLFNCLTGVYRVDSGSVHFFGRDITGYSVQKRALLGMGRSYQISRLFLELTVEENIVLAAGGGERMLRTAFTAWWKLPGRREWAQAVARDVGLADVLRSPVKDLSHGQQRQLEFGMTLAMRPKVILLDEPAAGLSPAERVVIRGLLARLPAEVTVLLIEHDMDVVLDFSERITVLHQGAVCAEGTPAEIRGNERVQRIYLGTLYDG